MLYRGPRGALPEDQGSYLFPRVGLLDQDIRDFVRPWRGVRHRHAVSVRHQLEPFLRCGGQRHRPVDGLRRPDRLFPRSELPRSPAVRPQAGATLGALLCGRHGCRWYALFLVLDPRAQFVDANSSRVRDHRRPVPCGRLGRRHLQSVVSVPHLTYRHGLSGDDRLRRYRRCGILSSTRTGRRGSAQDAVDDAVAAHRPGAAADHHRRPAWSQHLSPSACQDRRHGGPLGDPIGSALHHCRLARSGGRGHQMGNRGAVSRQPHPDPQTGRHGARVEGMATRGQAAVGDRLLVVSRDGRNRTADDAGHRPGELVALEGPALRHRLVPARVRGVPSAGLCRCHRRMDHDGGRAATVGDLRPDAHQGRRDTVVGRHRRSGLAHHLCDRLPRRLPRDALLHDRSRTRRS